MKLTKDEATILWKALKEQKYEINNLVDTYAKRVGLSSMDAFKDLENRLLDFSKDQRRTGRTSMDSMSDVVRRFVVRHKSVK